MEDSFSFTINPDIITLEENTIFYLLNILIFTFFRNNDLFLIKKFLNEPKLKCDIKYSYYII